MCSWAGHIGACKLPPALRPLNDSRHGKLTTPNNDIKERTLQRDRIDSHAVCSCYLFLPSSIDLRSRFLEQLLNSIRLRYNHPARPCLQDGDQTDAEFFLPQKSETRGVTLSDCLAHTSRLLETNSTTLLRVRPITSKRRRLTVATCTDMMQ